MFPYKDDNPTQTFPFITVALMAVNILIFTAQAGVGLNASVASFGALPHSIITMTGPQNIHPSFTVFTSMFMHGGLLHLGGNMLYLWIFGDNVEDRMGHARFLLFYLAGGIFAVYSHAISSPQSTIPMVGASGAIAAVLGAYMLMYPRAKVHTLIILGFYIQVIRLPALIVIGFWAIIQIVSGLMANSQAAQGGTAWFAHLGGFLFGLAIIGIFYIKRRSGGI